MGKIIGSMAFLKFIEIMVIPLLIIWGMQQAKPIIKAAIQSEVQGFVSQISSGLGGFGGGAPGFSMASNFHAKFIKP